MQSIWSLPVSVLGNQKEVRSCCPRFSRESPRLVRLIKSGSLGKDDCLCALDSLRVLTLLLPLQRYPGVHGFLLPAHYENLGAQCLLSWTTRNLPDRDKVFRIESLTKDVCAGAKRPPDDLPCKVLDGSHHRFGIVLAQLLHCGMY